MYAKLKQLYPNADFTSDIILQDDGDGVYIKHFDTAKLGTQPTQAAIDAVAVLIKPEIWTRIKTERDRRIQNGGYKVGAKWYHSDTFSRSQQMGLVMLGANLPANVQWKTMDNTFVTMTQTLAGQIFGTAAASDIAIFSAAEAHRVAMEASADPAAYDFTGGWPPMFGA
jgi:hypothetical protein